MGERVAAAILGGMDPAELTLARTEVVAQLRAAGRLATPATLPIAELHD